MTPCTYGAMLDGSAGACRLAYAILPLASFTRESETEKAFCTCAAVPVIGIVRSLEAAAPTARPCARNAD
jgi:hypothetical protein